MRKATFIVIAAFAMAVFVAPDAHGTWGHKRKTLDIRIAGSNFITSDENGIPTPLGVELVAIQNGIARGSGARLFNSNAELEAVPLDPAQFPPECLAMGQVGSNLVVSFVIIFWDGSLLSLFAGPASIFCSDGTDFSVDVVGTVTGGEGRFAGATGTFTGSAFSAPPRVTGQITVELD